MPPQNITAKDVLTAVRRKHRKDAVIREVVVDDPFHLVILNRWRLETNPARWEGKIHPSEVAPSIPDGWTPQDSPPKRRIDALIVESGMLTAVEIKISRADFKRDVEAKRRAWKLFTNRFVYATPKGLLQPHEIPEGCGLWEFDADAVNPRSVKSHGITVTKKAIVNHHPAALPGQVFVALAYRVSKYETIEERRS
ncbi:MmcB family DNA repair protein [Leifsonia sp. Leaf264]|uniref:MmcB family DNA repair protein n=1 Tax=Leifsonia sp. Leaf264 TaxID=1736314 RepID=UPI0006F21005|nr:MmcB family DNA repair protein [Leifsonia sp. Leaf264]KQO98892.1 hypothetical protein ASF30_12585 [Leifsonia sp. Leaf264]